MSAAAKKLFMTQPAVSQAIKELEEYYQVILFHRFSKRLELTRAGKTLERYAEGIILSFDDIAASLHQEDNEGVIRVGTNLTVGTALIYDYIHEFNKIHPGIKVEVYCTRSLLIEGRINDNELDIALMEDSGREPNYIKEPFFMDRIVIVGHKDDPLGTRTSLRFQDIANRNFLLREKGSGVRDQFDHLLAARGIKVNSTMESTSTTALVNAVKEGMGIAVLPYQLVKKYIDAEEIRELSVSDMKLGRELYIMYHPSKILSAQMEDFVEVIRTCSKNQKQ